MTTAHDQKQKAHRGPHIALECSLPSEVTVISPFANAVIHGNHEDRRKHVHVTCRCEPDEMSIAVRMKEKDSTLIMSRTPQPWKTSSRFTAMAST